MTVLDDNAVATGIYSKLTTGTDGVALMVLLTAIYRDEIPEGATLDYVRFFKVSEASQNTFSNKYWPLKFQFDIYAKATRGTETAVWRAGRIKKALTTAMESNSAVLTIDGFNSVCCRFDFASGDYSWEEGVKRIIVQYSILVGEG